MHQPKHRLQKWFIISGDGVRPYIRTYVRTKQTDQRVEPIFKLVLWLVLGRGSTYDSSLVYHNFKQIPILIYLTLLFIFLGDIEEAQKAFNRSYQLGAGGNTEDKSDHLLDAAALAIANNDFQTALETFQKVDQMNPGRPMVVNNIAVCYLYLGKLKEGLNFLESRITSNPTAYLYETPILNLCTLYELESSYAGQKKRSILDLVSQYKGDGIAVNCLKLQI